MGDDQRAETDQAPGDRADRVAIDPLQDQAQPHGPPADEEGRRIEVGHRRAAPEADANDDARGGDQPCQRHQLEGGPPQRLGPPQPGEDRQDEGRRIKEGAGAERVDGVEAHLGVAPAQFGRQPAGEVLAVELDQVVELDGVLPLPRVTQAGIGEGARIDAAAVEGLEEAVAEGGPRAAGGAGFRRDRQDPGCVRQGHVALAHLDRAPRRVGFIGPAGLLRANRRHPLGEGLLESHQLAEEIGGVRRLERVLQFLIQSEICGELHHGALEKGACLVVRRGEPGLVVDRGEVGRDFGIGEAAVARVEDPHRRLQPVGHLLVVNGEVLVVAADQRQHFGVVDREDPVGVGDFRAEADVEQPFVGGQRRGRGEHVPPRLGKRRQRIEAIRTEDGLAVRPVDRLLPLDLQEGGPRDGVERLDPAVGQHRQASEAEHVAGARIAPRQQRQPDEGEAQDQGEGAEDGLHGAGAARRRRANAARCWPNCRMRPSAIMRQARYGIRQLGLRTTCRMVVLSCSGRSVGTKLFW